MKVTARNIRSIYLLPEDEHPDEVGGIPVVIGQSTREVPPALPDSLYAAAR